MFNKTTISMLMAKHFTLLAICAVILSIFITSFFQGKLGVIGPDSDDVFRLVQIKDYLAGQSWFVTDQFRMGLEGGTDMHWSRIPDIPILILTHFFDIFMSQDRALIWAITIWPPLSAAILVWSLLVGAKHWGGEKTKVFTLILIGVFLLSFQRFSAGSIDHHNVQFGFLAMSVAFALDTRFRFLSYFISGCAAAMTVSIGAEVYLFVAVICGFMAVNWALMGSKVTAATQGFGVGFSAVLILAFVGTISPEEYSLVYCDALSLITVKAGVLGGVGLALMPKVSRFLKLDKTIIQRSFMLMGLAVLCASVLFAQAPQCLVNPLDSLPSEVTNLWLGNITEAVPIAQVGADKFQLIPYMIGAPITALIILILGIKKTVSGADKTEFMGSIIPRLYVKFLPFCLLIVALGLTFYQIRFYPFAYILAIIPLAGWLSKTYVETRLKNPGSVIYLAALVASAPAAWSFPGIILETSEVEANLEETAKDKKAVNCKSTSVLESLRALPTGTVSTDSDVSAFILNNTNHRILSGNYHRNWKGISTEIRISISEFEVSKKLLTENNIDYLYYCSASVGTAIHTNHNKNGLTAEIGKGNIPDYLERVSPPDLENGEAIIFKVKRPEN